MAATRDDDIPALATTAPSPVEKRDLLGNFCFYLHFAVLIFIVAGWADPDPPGLWFYLAFCRRSRSSGSSTRIPAC